MILSKQFNEKIAEVLSPDFRGTFAFLISNLEARWCAHLLDLPYSVSYPIAGLIGVIASSTLKLIPEKGMGKRLETFSCFVLHNATVIAIISLACSFGLLPAIPLSSRVALSFFSYPKFRPKRILWTWQAILFNPYLDQNFFQKSINLSFLLGLLNSTLKPVAMRAGAPYLMIASGVICTAAVVVAVKPALPNRLLDHLTWFAPMDLFDFLIAIKKMLLLMFSSFMINRLIFSLTPENYYNDHQKSNNEI